jgi:tRNA(Ile)-lysidine synthase
MDLFNQFNQFIKAENLFQSKDKLLLAVSGGVDSVVLCELCHRSGFDFVIAHCNFQLRGEESERDERFVRNLEQKYGSEVLVKQFDTASIAANTKKSIETTARELRYQWFYELINHSADHLLNYILTAHHADDNIETVAMNFFRGTGIAGLHGILSKQGKIIRPLLFARRVEIEQFAAGHFLDFVTDSSNLENDYTRNLFRNQVIPVIKQRLPEAEKNLLNNIQRFKEVEIIYQGFIDQTKKKLLEQRANEFHLPVLKLTKSKPLPTIVYEIIKDFGFTAHQTEEVISLLQRESGKYIQSSTHRILKNRNWLIITPIKSNLANNVLIEASDNKIEFDNGVLNIQTTTISNFISPKARQTSNLAAQLDAAEIKFPLLLRKWKQGDYFYPLGMKKKKKLSRFFIDQKLSLIEKENTWVIEMDKKIVWIVGMRIDNRFKIIPNTTAILLIHYEPK